MAHHLKAVVFDWAGTMIDFGSCAPVEALIAAFAEEGITLTAAQARRDMGRAKRDHVAAVLSIPAVAQAWTAAKGTAPNEDDVDRIYTALEPLMTLAAARHTELIPGALSALGDARARGLKVGSNTGYTRAMMQSILTAAAAQGYQPDAVVCAGETAEGRPTPLMMWKLWAELGIHPASACVKVDDAEVGIGEGRAAGCWTVGVAAAAAALSEAGAHYIVNTVADLPGILDQIETRLAAGELPA